MGLRPPIVRRPRGGSPPKAATVPDERPVRPIPERAGPRRTPETFLRGEPVERAAPDAATPIAQAVSQAYRVFDEYLKEGREFAAGESAWNRRGDASASGPVPTGQNGELLEALLWIFDQFMGLAPMNQKAKFPGSPENSARSAPLVCHIRAGEFHGRLHGSSLSNLRADELFAPARRR